MAEKQVGLLDEFKDKNKYMDRTVDRGIVNEETGSVIGIRGNGDISVAASENAQYKLNAASGSATEISMQSNTITNRKNIYADEIVVNKHKLNPQLVELSDMRQLKDSAIGNLMMFGTVLVRAWEPNLKKYVLIRRQIRLPIFSPMLNIADAPENMGINTDISEELIKMKKGE